MEKIKNASQTKTKKQQNNIQNISKMKSFNIFMQV